MTQHKPAPLNPASARWQARRRRMIAYGQWEPFVDAEPVREHLREVMAAGMPISAVSERLGLPYESSLQHVLYGRGDCGPGQKERRETAELVLSFWPSLTDFPDRARIDSTGTRRRMQALAVLGWPRFLMAQQIGMSETAFRKGCRRERVTARLARGVASLYDAWWDQDPLEHGVPAQTVARVRADAARDGFHGPLAWDDDTIDDPRVMPQTDALAPAVTEGGNLAARWLAGESVILSPAARREVLQHLMEWTQDTPEEIAAQLEMSLDALWQTWSRIKKKARMEGRPVPWRRVYALRDKNLTKTDMEEAA